MTDRPPSRLRINGRRWRVAVSDKIESDGSPSFGLCDEETHTISIRPGTRAFMRDTLFHELTHAACPGLTEEQVREVERGVYAVLADHPRLRAWLFEDD